MNPLTPTVVPVMTMRSASGSLAAFVPPVGRSNVVGNQKNKIQTTRHLRRGINSEKYG